MHDWTERANHHLLAQVLRITEDEFATESGRIQLSIAVGRQGVDVGFSCLGAALIPASD